MYAVTNVKLSGNLSCNRKVLSLVSSRIGILRCVLVSEHLDLRVLFVKHHEVLE